MDTTRTLIPLKRTTKERLKKFCHTERISYDEAIDWLLLKYEG